MWIRSDPGPQMSKELQFTVTEQTNPVGFYFGKAQTEAVYLIVVN